MTAIDDPEAAFRRLEERDWRYGYPRHPGHEPEAKMPGGRTCVARSPTGAVCGRWLNYPNSDPYDSYRQPGPPRHNPGPYGRHG